MNTILIHTGSHNRSHGYSVSIFTCACIVLSCLCVSEWVCSNIVFMCTTSLSQALALALLRRKCILRTKLTRLLTMRANEEHEHYTLCQTKCRCECISFDLILFSLFKCTKDRKNCKRQNDWAAERNLLFQLTFYDFILSCIEFYLAENEIGTKRSERTDLHLAKALQYAHTHQDGLVCITTNASFSAFSSLFLGLRRHRRCRCYFSTSPYSRMHARTHV